jgi:WD40 repeat protein
VAFSRDGKQLASGSTDGTLDVVDVAPPGEMARLDLESDTSPASVSMSVPGKRYFAILYANGKARLFELPGGKPVGKLVAPEDANDPRPTAAPFDDNQHPRGELPAKGPTKSRTAPAA